MPFAVDLLTGFANGRGDTENIISTEEMVEYIAMQIQVKKPTHIYSEGMPYESVALTDISFEINKGEFVGIIGHTGSGKSTLIQHLNGLLKPKSGSILIDEPISQQKM